MSDDFNVGKRYVGESMRTLRALALAAIVMCIGLKYIVDYIPEAVRNVVPVILLALVAVAIPLVIFVTIRRRRRSEESSDHTD
jgi:uncharacterized membrane protein AbrB (regulator of aidB expression)